MKINELKFQNLPSANSTIERWEKLPDNYKKFFITKGMKMLNRWITGIYMNNSQVNNEIGMTFKIIKYLVPQYPSLEYMYRATVLPTGSTKTPYFYNNRIQSINKNGGMYLTSNKKYQSWTTSLENAKKFYKTVLYYKRGIPVIFQAEPQNILFYVPNVYEMLDNLSRTFQLDIDSSTIGLVSLGSQNQNELVVRLPQRKVFVNRIHYISEDDR